MDRVPVKKLLGFCFWPLEAVVLVVVWVGAKVEDWPG